LSLLDHPLLQILNFHLLRFAFIVKLCLPVFKTQLWDPSDCIPNAWKLSKHPDRSVTFKISKEDQQWIGEGFFAQAQN